MILALTAKRSTLEELAEMVDSAMEVVLPSIAPVATLQATSEVGKLQAKVVSLQLQKQLSALQATER